MKRLSPWLAFAGGIIVLALVLPLFLPAQPHDVGVTRADAQRIADEAAAQLGIAPHTFWSALTWRTSPMLDKELERDPQRRAKAASDPVIGPRLGSYNISYYQARVPKFPAPYVVVNVSGRTGEVISSRLRLRSDVTGTHPTEQQLRARADAVVHSRAFPGAPNPQFESARPTILRTRTDWVFRYRVPSTFPIGKTVPLLNIYFSGDRFAGWDLTEEYGDGKSFEGDNGGDIAVSLVRFAVMFAVLLVLLIVFLRKYHAGEVGVETASVLFVFTLALLIIVDVAIHGPAAEGIGMGGIDARWTSFAQVGFKLLFVDLPLSLLMFLAWAVGESVARERWGDRLASFEALLRRDPINATVGHSVMHGILAAPAIAASAFGIAAIPILFHIAWPDIGSGTQWVVYLGGPLMLILCGAIDALLFPIGALLGVLAFASRRRVLWAGVVVALILGVAGGMCEPPLAPTLLRFAFGFGGIAAAIVLFIATDLLTTVIAVFFGAILLYGLPLIVEARGELLTGLVMAVAVPLLLAIVFAAAGLMTQREVVYTHDDLAPHVKRIIERERVKAEIDAANRIQAALLPLDVPELAGASVASHYRAATEIGGDYFDFLPQPNGEIGIAFGDVSGHGLTSGIVMAMAKSALLVQVGADASPRRVLEVLNDIVIRTAPKRMLMTFFFGLLDPATHMLRFASAGHLDPYVFRAANRRIEPLSSWGFPLGVKRRDPFREHTVEFATGDRLILYSDGLIEAVDDDGEPFGFDRFERVLADAGHMSADEIKKSLLAAVKKFTHNRPPEDDQTLVVVSFDEVAAQRAYPGRVAMHAAEAVN
jgi:hypothetical protein